MSTRSQAEYIDWMKHNEPVIYNLAVKRHALKNGQQAIFGLSEYVPLSAIDFGSFFSTLSETVTKAVPSLIALKSQKDILAAQLARAKQNLPPLNVADYAPIIKVNADVTPETEAALTRVATQTTGNIFGQYGVYIFGGAAALIYFLKMKKRR